MKKETKANEEETYDGGGEGGTKMNKMNSLKSANKDHLSSLKSLKSITFGGAAEQGEGLSGRALGVGASSGKTKEKYFTNPLAAAAAEDEDEEDSDSDHEQHLEELSGDRAAGSSTRSRIR